MSLCVAPAERLIDWVHVRTRVPGGPWFIDLSVPRGDSYYLGPYVNPATARDEAKRLLELLAALVEEIQRDAYANP